MSTPAPLVYVYNHDLPLWLQVFLGITAVVAALLLLTCLTLCCMRLCGCWTGNILGVGSLRRPQDETDHIGCWCCRPTVIGRHRIEDGMVSYTSHSRRNDIPITPSGVWMPHMNPVRNNKSSTK